MEWWLSMHLLSKEELQKLSLKPFVVNTLVWNTDNKLDFLECNLKLAGTAKYKLVGNSYIIMKQLAGPHVTLSISRNISYFPALIAYDFGLGTLQELDQIWSK